MASLQGLDGPVMTLTLDISQSSQVKHMRSLLYEWLPYKLEILGANGLIMPLVKDGLYPSTTFNTIGDLQATFTWGSDVADRLSYENGVPIITFDGSVVQADTPSDAFWSRDDGSGEGFSIGAWVYLTDATNSHILTKWGLNDVIPREWDVYFDGSDKLNITLRDASAIVNILRVADAATSQNVWKHVVATYDGAGGATAANTITIYEDGVVNASTATNNGSYVAMENGTYLPELGARGPSTGGTFFDGKMAGSSIGPFFTQKELSADEVLRIYQAEAKLLGKFQ